MKRPLFYSVIFFIFGVLAGQYINPLVGIALFFVFILSICFYLYIKFKTVIVYVFFISAILGFCIYKTAEKPISNDLEKWADHNQKVTITGTISDISETTTGKIKLILLTKHISFQQNKVEKELKVQCIVEPTPKVRFGDLILIEGELLPLSQPRNPGAFNEYNYLKARKIHYKTFGQVIKVYSNNKSLSVYLSIIRNKLSYVYDKVLPPKEAGIIKSIILGDKSDLESSTKLLYQYAGIYHIMAISGLHISILSLTLSFIFTKLFPNRLSGILLLFFLIMYCLLTGASSSTIRAVIMCAVIIFSHIVYRHSDLLTSLAIAALAILTYSPYYLWDTGFLYSFTAVLSIAVLVSPLERLISLLKTRIPIIKKVFSISLLNNYFLSSLAVFLGTIPIAACTFYFLLPYSTFVNILILPTVFLLVFSGLITGVVGIFSIQIAKFFAGTVYFLLNIYEVILGMFSALPFSTILIGALPLFIILLYYATLICLKFLLNKYGKDFMLFQKYFYISLSCLLIGILFLRFYPKPFEITMLDVDQGDCFVLQYKNKTFIIDGGGNLKKEIGENTGEKILIPYLNYKGISKIEGVFLSHTDFDHSAGIMELLGKKKIEKLFLPKTHPTDDENYQFILKKSKEYEIMIEHLLDNYVMSYGNYFTITCLSPNKELHSDSLNDNSLVLFVKYKKNKFLFTGDISASIEQQILNSHKELHADILKLSHHGSKTSNSLEFIKAVSPNACIVSAGVNNPYKHPSKDVTDQLDTLNIPLYNTAQYGAVIIKSNGEIITMKPTLEGLK